MRRPSLLPLLLAATALASALGGQRVPDAVGERLPARVPGTVRLRGDPDGVPAYRFVNAFPNLRFRRPLYVGAPPDGTNRLFVLEQGGRVLWFENRPDVKDVHVALDLGEKVYRRHNEEGLLGLAFHPAFRTNRTLFLHYSANGPRRGVVARFRTNAARTRIDPRSERVVLEQRQPWGNHNGGGLAFGPDGMLYVSFGDGGAGGDPLGSGQDRGTWLGSMLRIDVDGPEPYRVPPDNPFVGERGVRPEIWAYGLRNVWRFSFDRLTGTCWAGDVGQNAWEEIDILVRGGNYGWNLREGHEPFRGGEKRPAFIEPVVSHSAREARSITGGYVYRGRRLPGLAGAYVYADYATGWVWALRHDGRRVTRLERLGRGGNVSSFGEDEAGELYFTAFDGHVHGLAPAGEREAGTFPRRLSRTGLFTDTRRLVPHPALVPYEVNAPLFSDGAEKDRWVMLPDLQRVRVAGDGGWTFPEGTIFVKHFRAGTHRLETRLLALRDGAWEGYTYVWDEAQEDAWLIDGRADRDLAPELARRLGSPRWTFPGRADCSSCHTAQAGHVLGFRAEQLDRVPAGSGGENQLAAFARIGLFEGAPPRGGAWPDWRQEEPADPAAQVRAYLDANCAFCHRPGGTGNARIDLRFETPLARTGLVGAAPGQGDLGVAGARLLAPGDPERSLLWLRMRRTDEKGMPNLAHNRVDDTAVARVAAWIRALRE